jgi:hypothetical protein
MICSRCDEVEDRVRTHRPHGHPLKLFSAILGKKTYFLALNHSSDLT